MLKKSGYIIGIDSGNTITKAVIFTTDGKLVAACSEKVKRYLTNSDFVERDMNEIWHATQSAIRNVLKKSNLSPNQILAVSVTGHGDGLYLLDKKNEPLGMGITSLDGRAHETVAQWKQNGILEKALELSGQVPMLAAPATLLSWIKQNDPDRFRHIGCILSSKDWIRFKLTGILSTDWTEASTSFVNPISQVYDERILDLYGLSELKSALPEARDPCEIVGTLSKDAAQSTGLNTQTPVAIGLHDVCASALGSGVHEPGTAAMIAGTYSINEVISNEPKFNPNYFCRNSFHRKQWMNMAISPTSSSCIDWFIQQFCSDALMVAKDGSVFDVLEPELVAAFDRKSQIIFHPFLYGSPFTLPMSASFIGMKGWHKRGDLLKAVYEGIVFNHRYHLEHLASRFQFGKVRLTGGSSRSSIMCQLFSNALGKRIETVDAVETGALGAVICAGVGIGLYDNIADGVSQTVKLVGTYEPEIGKFNGLDEQYQSYMMSVEAARREVERAQ